MAEQFVTFTFDGPALAAGRMSVREFAPALLAFAEAVQSAQQLLQPNGPRVSLDIQATREGSFVLDLIVTDALSFADRLIDMFTSDPATAAANMTQLVTGVVSSFGAIRWIHRRRIRSREALSDGAIVITDMAGNVFKMTAQTWALIGYLPFRQAINQTVAPLRREGVEEIRVASERAEAVVQRDDIAAFDVPDVAEQEVGTSERVTAVTPVSITFVDGNKWRINDGSQTLWATVEDTRFLEAVDRGTERFGRGDILRVRLQTRQFSTADGLRAEHAILEVIAHVPAPLQVALPFQEQQVDYGDEGYGMDDPRSNGLDDT